MKKTYVNPELTIIALIAADIVTISGGEDGPDKEQNLWQPNGGDKDWDSVLGDYVNKH